MKIYRGWRDKDGACHVEVRESGDGCPNWPTCGCGTQSGPHTCEWKAARPLRQRLDLDNHSPTGFEWGYGGSGPAQLALALLADALSDDERAIALHQEFKWAVVCQLPHADMWKIGQDEIVRYAGVLEKRERTTMATIGRMLTYMPTGALIDPPETREFATLDEWISVAEGLEIVQKILGGYLEEIPYFKSLTIDGVIVECVAFCNEDGKRLQLPINRRATMLWAASFERHVGRPFKNPDGSLPDHLVGPVVVLTGNKEFMDSL